MKKIYIHLSDLPENYDFSKVYLLNVEKVIPSTNCKRTTIAAFRFNAGDFSRLFTKVENKIAELIENECNSTNEAFCINLWLTDEYSKKVRVSPNEIIQNNLLFNVDKQFD